jgi:riboflavin biosynthesis pyrimidine reductase
VTDLGVRLVPLYDEPETHRVHLPDELEAAYGGAFGLPERTVYANFVASIDGIAAIAGVEMSSAAISGGEPADRFVMALLRSVADAVVVGSGTLREHGGPWTAERAFPAGADLFRRARTGTSRSEAPTLVVVTASGELRADHPALGTAAVMTTSAGAQTLAERGIRAGEVIDLGEVEEPDPKAVIDALRERGHRRILTEGGPSLMGSMLEAAVVDQLFLTISPKLVGGGPGRPPLSDQTDLLDVGSSAHLMGVRRSGGYLFLRYGFD